MNSRVAVLVAGGLVLLAPGKAQARGTAQVHRLGLHYSSSHGCSQSHASTSFHGSLVLTLQGGAASLVLAGRHHYSMGPSLGRFRQSGGRDQTHHTASTIQLTWKGSSHAKGSTLALQLALQPPQCKTVYGYPHTTAYACTGAASLTLTCEWTQVPVHRATPSGGSGPFPDKTERPAQVKVLRCVPSGKNLGLLEHLQFESGFPLASGAGIVHHHMGMQWRRNSALRFPGKQPP